MLSQSSAVAGAPSFTLTVTGQNFLSTSLVYWNGVPLTTTFTSATLLTAMVPAADLAAAGTVQVAVVDPSPTSLLSNSLPFTVTASVQPAPVLSSLSATSVTAGSVSFALTITGQNFLPSSVAQFNGLSLTTVVNSATQLVATVPASNLSAAGTFPVAVVDPSPLSLTSNVSNFTVNPIPPIVSFITPSSAIVNSGPVNVTISGQNFASGATVTFGSTRLAVTSQTANQIVLALPASALTSTGTSTIVVSNVAPNAASSIPFVFTVNPVPVATISSISPTSVTAGVSSLTLQVTGSAFPTGATLQLNGTAVTTNNVASSLLFATIPDSLLASAGTVAVTVLSPGSGSGPLTSNAVNLTVNPLPAGDIIVNQTANSIVYDPQHQLIYASVPSSATQNGNSIVAINPSTGAITKTVYAGSEPDLMAISDDGQFLYVALDGASAVQRFLLPAMTPDILVSLGGSNFYGTNTALAIGVAPATPHTWMVSVGNPGTSPEAIEGITVFDDATARPTTAGRYTSHPNVGDLLLGSAVWGADATVIYGSNNESTGFDFYVLPVTSAGIPGAGIKDYEGALSSFSGYIHFDKTTHYVYADSGPVLNPATGSSVGVFATNGVMVPDGSIGKAFFAASGFGASAMGTITSFDINHFTPINSMVFPNVNAAASSILRWGTNGLAFNTIIENYAATTTTKSGKIYLYSGSFVQ